MLVLDMCHVLLCTLLMSAQAKVDRVRGINLRIARKRPLAALTWSLAPGLKIGVQVRAARCLVLW